jgi:hypothetical protein
MRALTIALLAFSSCMPNPDHEVVTTPSGREFRVMSVDEEAEYKGHCALKVTYLSDEASHAKYIEEMETLREAYHSNQRANQCDLIVFEAVHVMPRVGGLFWQTMRDAITYERGGGSNWRRISTR